MLDVSLRSGILRVMLDLRERRGIGILFITHDLSLAWLIADRIAVMYLGRVMEIGPADELVRDPRHPYTRALLSVMPSPDPAHRRQRQSPAGRDPRRLPDPAGCRFHTRCPLAFDRCRVEVPPSVEVSPGHVATCFLAGEPATAPGPAVVRPGDAERAGPDAAGRGVTAACARATSSCLIRSSSRSSAGRRAGRWSGCGPSVVDDASGGYCGHTASRPRCQSEQVSGNAVPRTRPGRP